MDGFFIWIFYQHSDDTKQHVHVWSSEKKLLLLSQVYAGQLRNTHSRIEKNKRVSYLEQYQVWPKDLFDKTITGHINLKQKTLLVLNLSRRCSWISLEFQRNHHKWTIARATKWNVTSTAVSKDTHWLPTDDILKQWRLYVRIHFVLNKEKSR